MKQQTGYTIGHTENYDLSLRQLEVVTKIGKSEDYPGGWVWATADEARSFISSQEFLSVDWGDGRPRDPAKFSVYQLELPNDWATDVSEADQIGTRHLLNDAIILGKVK